MSAEEQQKRKVEVYIHLREVLTLEQLEQIADILARVQYRARERRCEQTVLIVFNEKGLPRHINASDNVRVTYVEVKDERV